MSQATLFQMERPDREEILSPVGKRICKGVNLFDMLFGASEWRSRIEIPSLDMSSYNMCAVAQLFGDYRVGCIELQMNPHSKAPFLHGLNILDPFSLNAHREYDVLRRGWIIAIQKPALANLKRLKIAA